MSEQARRMCVGCGAAYGWATEQAVCIEESRRCIVCEMPNMTARDTQRFHDEALRRLHTPTDSQTEPSETP